MMCIYELDVTAFTCKQINKQHKGEPQRSGFGIENNSFKLLLALVSMRPGERIRRCVTIKSYNLGKFIPLGIFGLCITVRAQQKCLQAASMGNHRCSSKFAPRDTCYKNRCWILSLWNWMKLLMPLSSSMVVHNQLRSQSYPLKQYPQTGHKWCIPLACEKVKINSTHPVQIQGSMTIRALCQWHLVSRMLNSWIFGFKCL